MTPPLPAFSKHYERIYFAIAGFALYERPELDKSRLPSINAIVVANEPAAHWQYASQGRVVDFVVLPRCFRLVFFKPSGAQEGVVDFPHDQKKTVSAAAYHYLRTGKLPN